MENITGGQNSSPLAFMRDEEGEEGEEEEEEEEKERSEVGGERGGVCNIKGNTALDLFHIEQECDHIVTFSARIDGMLEGGVSVGKITEFCGAPGIGKTQMSIQLAVDATLPIVFGGCGGDSIYIDTEGSFIIERVVQIATAAVSHVRAVARNSGNKDLMAESERYTLESVLKRIHYYRCHSYVHLIALSNVLHQTITVNQNKVCLVVVDSIASPFRHDFKDVGLRNRLLCGLAQNFIKLAVQFKLAVVMTNQMTTRGYGIGGMHSQLVPSLGESWGHMPTIRVILYWSEDERGEGEGGGRNRMALLFKSPSQPETCVPYQITRDGVRDVVIIEKEYSSSDKISNKIRQETEKEVVTAEATAPLHNSTSIQDKMSPLSHSSLPFKRKCPVEM